MVDVLNIKKIGFFQIRNIFSGKNGENRKSKPERERKNSVNDNKVCDELKFEEFKRCEDVEMNSSTVKIKKNSALNLLMPKTTAEQILKFLDQFEREIGFVEKNVSLSGLSVLCETNSKYLSNVIKVYKKASFRDYINGLRVNYIVGKLQDEPVYREYKIAVLAEEVGFSSSNKLSSAFKKHLGVLPSVYIKSLNQAENFSFEGLSLG